MTDFLDPQKQRFMEHQLILVTDYNHDWLIQNTQSWDTAQLVCCHKGVG